MALWRQQAPPERHGGRNRAYRGATIRSPGRSLPSSRRQCAAGRQLAPTGMGTHRRHGRRRARAHSPAARRRCPWRSAPSHHRRSHDRLPAVSAEEHSTGIHSSTHQPTRSSTARSSTTAQSTAPCSTGGHQRGRPPPKPYPRGQRSELGALELLEQPPPRGGALSCPRQLADAEHHLRGAPSFAG